jgi:uncharacterized protein
MDPAKAPMFARLAVPKVREALADTPAVLVTGPRRSGKTTLVRTLIEDDRLYVTLDDQSMFDAAKDDPVGFIRGMDRVAIDEVQRVPELLLAIKKSIDDDRRPGRFLLTGSANVMTLPKVADSLAGRMETIPMLPLAQCEILGTSSGFLDDVFAGSHRQPRHVRLGEALIDMVLTGGFPEVVARPREQRQREWARSYLESVLTRDIRDIATIERLSELPRFVRLLASHAGQLVNYSQLGAGIGVTYKTGQRYVDLLQQIFLIATLPPWYSNAIKRIVKTPKLHFLDSAVLATLLGHTRASLVKNKQPFGSVLESFVYTELRKLMVASTQHFTLSHFRTNQMQEVDLVLERSDGQLVGIEVKASATVRSADFNGLHLLAETCGQKFARGIVLYDGEAVIPFAENLAAAPLSCLWN